MDHKQLTVLGNIKISKTSELREHIRRDEYLLERHKNKLEQLRCELAIVEAQEKLAVLRLAEIGINKNLDTTNHRELAMAPYYAAMQRSLSNPLNNTNDTSEADRLDEAQ